MTTAQTMTAKRPTGVSLVDGDSAVRHARQILLRSENYDVRSYATSAAILADPKSREYPCIVLDVEVDGIDGPGLLREMRASGWSGSAIILDGLDEESPRAWETDRNGDRVYSRHIGDRSLLAAIASTANGSVCS